MPLKTLRKHNVSLFARTHEEHTGSKSSIGHVIGGYGNINVIKDCFNKTNAVPSLILMTRFLLKVDHPLNFFDKKVANRVLFIHGIALTLDSACRDNKNGEPESPTFVTLYCFSFYNDHHQR